MTVAELIEKLREMPPGHHVYRYDSGLPDQLVKTVDVRAWDWQGPDVVILK